jgi:uridine phosphorylase
MAATSVPPSFPNVADKHDDRCLINPEAFVEYHRTEGAYRDIAAPRAAILCYHRGLAEHLRATRAMHVIPGFFGDTMLIESSGREVALVANFGIGAPVAAVMLEDLIALGAREVISIGTAGALQPGMRIGDIVVCNRAIRDEGTSHHYLPAARHAIASPALTARAQVALDARGVPYTTGTSWTVDAPYRETVGEARHYRDEGVVCVEMEAAALFAVAQHRGAAVTSLLTVSDSLADLEWAPAFHADETLAGLETLFDAALAVLDGG